MRRRCACACTTPTTTRPRFDYSIPPLPEGASGYTEKPGWSAQRFMVAAANPLATDAGYQVLKAGGSAVDAAIAVQMVLSLVEPQSSGIGGGAFLLHWDGKSVAAWDGRETAPAAADEKLFVLADAPNAASRCRFATPWSAGARSACRARCACSRRCIASTASWPGPRLFQPAITLAEQGFRVSPRLHTQLKAETALKNDAQARAYFYGADGEPLPVGTVVKNPALAEVLRGIASRGSAALLSGPVAADIVKRVRGHATNPGQLSEADLAGYTPKRRESICTVWKVSYRVCGFPPPSSGHIAVMQILGMLERTPPVPQALVDKAPSAPLAARLHRGGAPGLRRPRAVPGRRRLRRSRPAGRWTSLLDDAYLKQRAALIGAQSMGRPSPARRRARRARTRRSPSSPNAAPATSHRRRRRAGRWR